MDPRDALLPEFDMEMAKTRTALERIPEDKLGWKPHDKSMTLGRLAGHVVEMPGWIAPTIDKDALDVAPPGGEAMQAMVGKSRAELLSAFDRNVAEGRA